jgi:hypothetical protein
VDIFALFMGPGVVIGIGIVISISGAEGLGMGSSFDLQHFFQVWTPTRKIAIAIRIRMAKEVKVQ